MTEVHPARERRYPLHGWIGAVILIVAEALLLLKVRLAALWFTPIMWTGYILVADGLVYRLRGTSWLNGRRREFPLLALVSTAVWLLFEAYNFKLQNWQYLNVPPQPLLRSLAYFWSFATIMPGVFETGALVEILLERSRASRPTKMRIGSLGPRSLWFVLGLAMVTIPPITPANVAPYLFGPIWMGFIFLLDPINELMGAPSLRAQLRSGQFKPMLALLVGGLACGFLWETWNYQAFSSQGAYWNYTIPQSLRIFGWHFGKMPVLGLLGFPPFALELNAFYHLIRKVLGVEHLVA